ncbi:hypothetical protein EV356DRAFT_329646 [Viridothelium virens]|uniref:Uncharacterized protein n=1 Tax=Viridothelium virens TaxID=1048519 RepID=A0A6A6GXS6_VIRVR|nr:hypothetical protein EV356DRAFT_329646 [Viridothelium virens]
MPGCCRIPAPAPSLATVAAALARWRARSDHHGLCYSWYLSGIDNVLTHTLQSFRPLSLISYALSTRKVRNEDSLWAGYLNSTVPSYPSWKAYASWDDGSLPSPNHQAPQPRVVPRRRNDTAS